jgi:hypothetical protein
MANLERGYVRPLALRGYQTNLLPNQGTGTGTHTGAPGPARLIGPALMLNLDVLDAYLIRSSAGFFPNHVYDECHTRTSVPRGPESPLH